MKTRNFVAKHAQRSGAGRHKRQEKALSDYVLEDVYEQKYEDLKILLSIRQEEEIQVLAKIIRIRDFALANDSVLVYHLNDLISWYHDDVIREAAKLIMRQDEE
jgi:hypothetical protein